MVRSFLKKFEDNKQKKLINSYIAKHSNKNGLAIVLDGKDMKTSKALINARWERCNIHCPNYSEDFNKMNRSIANIYPTTLGRFLEGIEEDSVSCIYADYMCTMEGNQFINPIKDLEYIFHNKLLKNECLFGITLSLRTHDKNTTGFNGLSQKITSIISTLAYENGYVAITEPIGGIYKNGGPMWTGIFTILKC